MSDGPFRPVLAGQKALVIGVANGDSIAYGCAKAFRATGAELAMSWLNEKARKHVEPLAQELEAAIVGEVDVWRRCSTRSARNGGGSTSWFTRSPSLPRPIFRAAS
jgi:enoyl-[acyl-carrier-protein] reductase (NADH)